MRTLRLALAIAILSFTACKKSEDKAKDEPAKTAPTVAPSEEKAKADEKAEAKPSMEPATQPTTTPPAPVEGGGAQSDAVKVVEKVADEMCQCHDAECATKVVSENSEAMAKMTGFTPSSVEEGDAIMMASKRMSECAAKIPME